MRTAGLDIGSTTVELVVIDSGNMRDENLGVLSSVRFDTTPHLSSHCRRALNKQQFDRLMVTGYGRALGEIEFNVPAVTEIKAVARGAEAILPGCRTVLDVGGQDTKAVALDGTGRVSAFEMNDRCAAGAGRFLEMMARVLEYGMDEFGPAARKGNPGVKLTSMCAVFAESEVVSLVTQGRRREDIARAVHDAIVRRTVNMLGRVSTEPPVLFVGGAARDTYMAQALSDILDCEINVPPDPQMVSALGAAILGVERAG